MPSVELYSVSSSLLWKQLKIYKKYKLRGGPENLKQITLLGVSKGNKKNE